MTDETIKQALRDAQQGLATAIGQRDALNMKIIQLQNQVRSLRIASARNALAARVHQQESAVVGLTEAIRSIFRIRQVPMTAGAVKDALDLVGFDFSNFSNPSSAVHNTLKRMVDTGELTFAPGIKVYRMRYTLMEQIMAERGFK
jgi:hypothetical protein